MVKLVMLITLGIAYSAFAGEGWNLVSERNGLKVYQQMHEDSPFIGMRGEAVLDYSIDKVFSILVREEYRQKWVDRLESLEVLEEKNEGREVVLMMVIDMPWPLKNREFLVRNHFSVLDSRGTISSAGASFTDERWPVDQARVRGDTYDSRIILSPVADNKTHLTIISHADPKGKLPPWVVNYIQRSWPANTINNVSKLLKKHSDLKIDPLFYRLTEDKRLLAH